MWQGVIRTDSVRCLRTCLAWCILNLLSGPLTHLAAAEAEIKINGVDYINLHTVARQLGMKYHNRWKTQKRATLLGQWARLEFELHKRDFLLNGIRVFMGRPAAISGLDLYISSHDYELTLRALLTPQFFPDVPKLYRIVIDPGHGGKDAGTRNQGLGLKEKTFVLDTSNRLAKILRKHGYFVILTRGKDNFVPLRERAERTNQFRADLFISVHFNGVKTTRVSGVETYSMPLVDQPPTARAKPDSRDHTKYPGNGNDPWNTLLGYYVHKSLVNELGTVDRGLKRERYEVLKYIKCPGILVEAGFLTNPTEARKIRSSAHRQKIAQGIADGILLYQKTINRLRNKGLLPKSE